MLVAGPGGGGGGGGGPTSSLGAHSARACAFAIILAHAQYYITDLFALFDQVRRFVIDFWSGVLLQLLVLLHGVCLSLLGLSNCHTGVVTCSRNTQKHTSFVAIYGSKVLEFVSILSWIMSMH